MASCILPFETDVEMRAYHHWAFPLGIIKANISDYDCWLCNKLIDSEVSPNYSFNALERELWSFEDGLALDEAMYISPKTFVHPAVDFLAFIKAQIDEGNYIIGTYNERYIPHKSYYMNSDFNHDYVLFGYDDNINAFKSIGYIADRRYRAFDIDYDDFIRAVTGQLVPRSSFHVYHINRNFSPQFNIQELISKLGKYLISSVDDRGYLRGIDAWDNLPKYVLSGRDQKLDMRNSRVYMEHHGIMVKRIQTLTELKFVRNESLARQYHDQVYIKAQQVHYMFLKYNFTKREHYLHSISEIVKEINRKERYYLSILIDQLQSL